VEEVGDEERSRAGHVRLVLQGCSERGLGERRGRVSNGWCSWDEELEDPAEGEGEVARRDAMLRGGERGRFADGFMLAAVVGEGEVAKGVREAVEVVKKVGNVVDEIAGDGEERVKQR